MENESNIIIRIFNIEDEDSLINLWRLCNLLTPWNDPLKDIRRKLAVDADLFLVGELNNRIIASVMGGYEGHRGWINYLAVHPDHQRKGYGRLMMQAAEERIKAKGCPKINLQVRSSNQSVIQFYQRIGYKEDHVLSMGKRFTDDEAQADDRKQDSHFTQK